VALGLLPDTASRVLGWQLKSRKAQFNKIWIPLATICWTFAIGVAGFVTSNIDTKPPVG